MIVIRLAEVAESKSQTRASVHFGTKLSYPTILRYWNSTANQIDLKVLDTICTFLDCEPGDLIKRVKQ